MLQRTRMVVLSLLCECHILTCYLAPVPKVKTGRVLKTEIQPVVSLS